MWIRTKLIWVKINFFPKICKPAEPNFSKVLSSLLMNIKDYSTHHWEDYYSQLTLQVTL